MGGGSTVTAALAVGYDSIGKEIDPAFFGIAEKAVPPLAKFNIGKRAATTATRRTGLPSQDVLALTF
jgi:hypothetical protein